MDGFYSLYEYASNGSIIRQETANGLGYRSEKLYDENNHCYYILTENEDDSRFETTFYANGSPAKEISSYADGSSYESIFYENGQIKLSVSDDASRVFLFMGE